MKVLVVDDCELVRTALGRFLAHWDPGTLVIQAGDGAEGILLAREWAPSVMFCDLRMPVVDGWAFLEEVRHDASLNRTPVIVLTGERDEAGQRAALAAGARLVLTKPVRRATLELALACAFRPAEVAGDAVEAGAGR